MTVCIMVNEEKFQSHNITLTLIGQCPVLNSYKLFSYTMICSRFKWIEPLFFELSCTQTHAHRQKDGNTDGDEYSIVAVDWEIDAEKNVFRKNIVAFTNRTVFIQYSHQTSIYIYILLSLFGLVFLPWDSEESSYNSQLPGSLTNKYLQPRQITLQLSFIPKPYLTV